MIDSIRPDLGLRPMLRIVCIAPLPAGSAPSCPDSLTATSRFYRPCRRLTPVGSIPIGSVPLTVAAGTKALTGLAGGRTAHARNRHAVSHRHSERTEIMSLSLR